ncbi:DUF3846 domain-containing protein [Rhodococcus qingshengii]|uniref:DUF3846 domain-containing protein n=1 Tax=Rhodococcus qingshengii TaxID=334542 RepID=UPI002942443C|nr:DUF3846 domain-containing protein [Rhodococcus qingshengii]WOI90199.1 DUF3846 domain-containing protein [Rhodococcus qingshengii]
MIISGIFIPHDEEEPLRTVEFEQGDYKAIQGFIGGTFGVINIERPALSSIFVHDDGKIIGLPLNRRATMLLWASDSKWRHFDAIMGDALVLGIPDDEGETMGVPAELDELLLHTSEYKMEVQTVGDGDSWSGNGLRFSEPFEAYNYVLGLADRWGAVTEVRIVPV